MATVQQMVDAAIRSANGSAAKVRSLEAAVQAGNAKVDTLEKMLAGKMSYADRIVACAEKVIPFRYNIQIDLTTNTQARTPGSVTIDQDGWFLHDRIYASLRVNLALDALDGRYRPISSGNPAIAGSAAIAGAQRADTFDFVWELVEGSSQRGRQNNVPTPGCILFRQDYDGKLMHPDVFPPASVVTVFVTPLRAVESTATLVFTLEGRQCLNVIEDA